MQWKCAGLQALALGLAMLASGGSRAAAAETVPSGAVPPQTSLTGELGSLARRAATVFSGQVVAVDRRAGAVEVTFRVEQPVVGAVGKTFVLREWAGLWPQGQVRYYVGERALLFVHPASVAGFASPVDGQEGVVPVVVEGADAPELLDIRRLAAALQRAPGTPLPTEADGAIQLFDAIQLIIAAHGTSATAVQGEPARLPLHSPRMPVRLPNAQPSSLTPATPERTPQPTPFLATGEGKVAYAAR